MKLNTITIFLFVIITIISCTDKEGDWDDIIELSQKEVNFDSNADSVTVTTKGDWWWVANVRLNDELIDIDSINTTSSNFEIHATELSILRKSTNEIQIKINENPSIDQRELIIGVQAGNYFDYIKIIQEGK